MDNKEEMLYREVGEVFEYEGKYYTTVSGTACSDCDFCEAFCSIESIGATTFRNKCIPNHRFDNKHVIYKEATEEEYMEYLTKVSESKDIDSVIGKYLEALDDITNKYLEPALVIKKPGRYVKEMKTWLKSFADEIKG